MLFDSKLLRKVKVNTKAIGLKPTILELLKTLGVKSISVKGSIPATGSVLLISNHPGVFDSLALIGKVNRNDFHFVALSTYSIFGGAVQKQLLPIFRKRQLNHKLYEYPLSIQVNGVAPESLSQQEIRRRNRATISKAAALVNQEKVVSIYPTGSVGKSLYGSKWKPGVGFLIKQIVNPETQVVFANIKGTKWSDIFAYTHPLIRKLLFRPKPIEITFSQAFPLSQIVDLESDAKAITCSIEELYNQSFND